MLLQRYLLQSLKRDLPLLVRKYNLCLPNVLFQELFPALRTDLEGREHKTDHNRKAREFILGSTILSRIRIEPELHSVSFLTFCSITYFCQLLGCHP